MNETLRCASCGTTAPAAFVACPSCHRLFHADELKRLVADADAHEAEGRVLEALTSLRATLPLLPAQSAQATALQARIAALETKAGAAGSSKMPKALAGLGAFGAAVWKFGAPLLALLSKGKFLLVGLFQAKTLISMFIAASFHRSGGPLAPVLVFFGSIYVHEMGHAFAFRRYGIEVTPPMFVPGIGAFVRGTHYPTAAEAQADVALAGPQWGAWTGIVVLVIGAVLREPWLLLTAVAIAEVNQFNLIPVWQLDGNRTIQVLSPFQRGTAGVVGLVAGLASGSIMGTIAGLGTLARAFVLPGNAPMNSAVQQKNFLLILQLAALRWGAAYFAAGMAAH